MPKAEQSQCPKCFGWKFYTSLETKITYTCSYCKGSGIVWRRNAKDSDEASKT